MLTQLTNSGYSKRKYFILLFFAVAFLTSVRGFSQITMSGETSVSSGYSYYYYPAYYNNSDTYYYGNYYYYVSGGTINYSFQNTLSGYSYGGDLYSIGIDVTWDNPSGGYIYFSCDWGDYTLYVSPNGTMNPGTLTASSQLINAGTYPGTIYGTYATDPSNNNYDPNWYEWETSEDGVNWNSTYTYGMDFTPPQLYTSTSFRRKVTDPNTYEVAYTDPVSIDVMPALTNTINSTAVSVSSNTNYTMTTAITGGGIYYSYQWYTSSNGTDWTAISGAGESDVQIIGTSYTKNFTTSGYFYCAVTSNGQTVNSATLYVTVTSVPSAAIAITNTTASGNGSINTLSCTPGGGNGSYTYAWYYSTDGGSNWQALGATAQNYTTGVITSNTSFRVTVSSNGYSSNSNVISITMPTAPTISTSASTLCNGASATLTASSGSGNYKWYNASNTLLGTGSTYATTTAGTYYATSSNTYGISGNSNTVSITVPGNPSVGSIVGSTVCILGSSTQLTNSSGGGTWSSSNTSILKVDNGGIVSGVANGSATVTYQLTNGCGTSSQQLAINIVPFSSYSAELGKGIQDPLITDIVPLTVNAQKITQYQQDVIHSSAHSIKNVIALRVKEETEKYIPGDFSATAVVKVEYGHSQNDLQTIDSIKLDVNFKKAEGNSYDALNYFTFNNAEYVKLTVIRVEAPTTIGAVNFDTKEVLLLTNMLAGSRYYKLADNKKPVLYMSDPGSGTPDELPVNWTFPENSNNNGTQLEWAWLENEMTNTYSTGGLLDTSSLFRNNATRIDLAGGPTGVYKIPLFYGGQGKLFMRVRGTSIMPSGSRSDGVWSGVKTFSFDGHSESLNWQVTTSFAEEGKRKSVIQYYDGSLRNRQTVTKDNSTQKTIVAETIYDGQGRPAIQILPAPGINNIVAYTKNLNKFYNQPDNTDPLDYFDFTTTTSGKYKTEKLDPGAATAKYYSSQNPELNNATYNKNIPDANGYPYAVTRYTPDATGRIMMQSGVGDSMRMGTNHVTKYYYGNAAQEELDALFGTEVGNYTHYFKNMVQDANGQMSVSYVDMHGRTIATALAGEAPAGMQSLNINDATQYNGQSSKILTRNLLEAV